MRDDYSDIIGMEHHVSRVYPQMDMSSRAAQFAPFAALTGHEEAVKETQRETVRFEEICDDKASELDQRLSEVISNIGQETIVTISYFEYDKRKKGGQYKVAEGIISRVDETTHELVMKDGKRIALDVIYDIDTKENT